MILKSALVISQNIVYAVLDVIYQVYVCNISGFHLLHWQKALKYDALYADVK